MKNNVTTQQHRKGIEQKFLENVNDHFGEKYLV